MEGSRTLIEIGLYSFTVHRDSLHDCLLFFLLENENDGCESPHGRSSVVACPSSVPWSACHQHDHPTHAGEVSIFSIVLKVQEFPQRRTDYHGARLQAKLHMRFSLEYASGSLIVHAAPYPLEAPV